MCKHCRSMHKTSKQVSRSSSLLVPVRLLFLRRLRRSRMEPHVPCSKCGLAYVQSIGRFCSTRNLTTQLIHTEPEQLYHIHEHTTRGLLCVTSAQNEIQAKGPPHGADDHQDDGTLQTFTSFARRSLFMVAHNRLRVDETALAIYARGA